MFSANECKRRRIDEDISRRVEEWSRMDKQAIPPRPPKKVVEMANPEVPEIDNYEKDAPESFWRKFPLIETGGRVLPLNWMLKFCGSGWWKQGQVLGW